MKTTRRSAFFAFALGGLLLGVLAGCGTSNPYLGKAEEDMEKKNYEQALANIDSALVQDSTVRGKAYKMRAEVLREMADSTMAPSEYKKLYRQARAAEDSAVKYDPGARSEVKAKRTLVYTQQFQKGGKVFQRAQQSGDSKTFGQAAAHFGAASATYPDSAGPILNEAYALLNRERTKQDGQMENAMPVLERYIETAENPAKNAYDILSALYLRDGQLEKGISLLEKAREDLSARPTYFKLAGSPVEYSGSVNVGGNTREVEGTIPDKVTLDGAEGTVSGTFKKSQKKGQLRVQLFYKGAAVQDTISKSGVAEALSVSANLNEEAPLAQLEGRLLNAYNKAGKTKKAMAEYRDQIEKDPENVTYRYNYGSMLLNEERYDEAIEQLKKAVELEPGNAKAQYNLGASYSNKAQNVQDTIRTIQDSLSTIRDRAMEENRTPTEEEKALVNKLDKESKRLTQKKKELFEKAIPALERARQLVDSGESLREDACVALFTAYMQTERVRQAKKIEDCAGVQMNQNGQNQGGN